MKRHAELVQQLNPRAAEYYRCLAAQDPPFRLEYVPGLGQEPKTVAAADDDESTWLKALQTALVESEPIEARRGYTVVGPHTDEIAMFLGDAPIQRFGSQGQQRTAALALRLAEIDWLRSISAREPVILADEIFGELDEDRRAMVWEHLCQAEQLWLTAAKGSGLEQFGPFKRRFIVESGVLL
jgi:DNA replication and repair protein RecF